MGFNVQMRKLRILSRIRDLVTLALIMGSIGTAIGYAVARRGSADTDREW